jgi:dipeptidyl aminopeptidase/acylaminoacyl peptidase
MRVPASGGTPVPATTLDETRGETAHRFPQFLPDGKHFLYVALPGTNSMTDTRIGTLDAVPGPVVLSSPNRASYGNGYMLFNQNESVMAQPFDMAALKLTGTPQVVRGLGNASASYSGSPVVETSAAGILVQREIRSDDTRVTLLDRAGHPVRQLPLPTGLYSELTFSPDGSRLALTYGISTAEAHVWVADIARGITTRIEFEGKFDTAPQWTPDGKRLVWGSDRESGRNLYWKPADGSGSDELLADVPNLFNDPGSVTEDVLIYRSLSGETNEDIWVLPLKGERVAKPLIQSRFNELDACLSPDGKWLAYRCDESGRFEIYVVAYPSLAFKVRISSDGAAPDVNTYVALVRWRKDGREFYYVGGDGRTVMAVPVETGEAFHAGTPRPLFRLSRETVSVDAAPDGQTFAVSVPAQVETRSILNLVVNWDHELSSK